MPYSFYSLLVFAFISPMYLVAYGLAISKFLKPKIISIMTEQQKKIAELQQTILASQKHLCEMESSHLDQNNGGLVFTSEEKIKIIK